MTFKLCHHQRLRYAVASGEANGLPIVFREDGYINMTKAARDLGKDLKEFFKNKGTKEYIKAMEVMGGIPPITLKQAKKGYHANPDVGTYGHPKLAVFFARWLDVRFAVWCDLMIDNILQGNIQTSVVVPTAEAEAGLHHKSDIWSQPFADSRK